MDKKRKGMKEIKGFFFFYENRAIIHNNTGICIKKIFQYILKINFNLIS
jgi:hypothetical protein